MWPLRLAVTLVILGCGEKPAAPPAREPGASATAPICDGCMPEAHRRCLRYVRYEGADPWTIDDLEPSGRYEPCAASCCASWTSRLRGEARDAAGGEPLAGTTVVASGGVLGKQTRSAITSSDGRYDLGALPVGAIDVTFYYAELIVKRSVLLGAHRTSELAVAIDVTELGKSPPALRPGEFPR